MVVYRRSDAETFDLAQRTVVFKPGENNYFQQVPLYAVPNQPFPSGHYRLTAKVESMDGRVFSASIDLLIQ